METKITFYILQEITIKARNLYACRIINKAVQNKHKVYVYFNNDIEAQNFDTQLWTFRDISFVPHTIYKKPMENIYIPLPKVLIATNLEPPQEQKDILINFSTEIPIFFKNFQRIIEVVSNDQNFRVSCRKHYKFYQQQEYQIETHHV